MMLCRLGIEIAHHDRLNIFYIDSGQSYDLIHAAV